jgi:ribonucleoside-diphosphate reductase alpha chain
MENNEYEKEKLTTVPDEIIDLFVTTGDLTAKEHGKVQCALQEGVDSAISKTVNAPADATKEDTAEAFKRIYEDGGKGVTYYRDGTRSKQVLTTRADNQELDEDEFVDDVVEKIDEDEELLKEIMQESERFDVE